MTRNTGTLDWALRAFVVAPVAITVAFIVGAGTIGGLMVFAVAEVVVATAARALCLSYSRRRDLDRPATASRRPTHLRGLEVET